MLWIKRNLVLLIGVIVSLGLLGGAGYYVYSNSDESFARDEELVKVKAELDQLQSGVYPSESNVGVVRSNITQIHTFTSLAAGRLATEPQKAAGETQIKVGLANLVETLRREATNAGVEIPARYEFTYGEVKVMPRLPVFALDPLTNQFKEVRAICNVLFAARVRALESIHRVPAFADERRTADLLTDLTPRTNVLSPSVSVVTTPYKLVFRGFSSHLTDVLNGFANSEEFFVVGDLDVEPSSGSLEVPSGGPPGGMMQMALPGAPPGLPGFATPPPPSMAFPGGAPSGLGGGRPAGMRPAGGTNAPPSKSSLTKVLDEKPLRISISLDVVKVFHSKTSAPPVSAK